MIKYTHTYVPLNKLNVMQCFQTDPDDKALAFQVQCYPSGKLQVVTQYR